MSESPAPAVRKPFGGLNADRLRLLACLLMLLDHIWATVAPGNPLWMTCAGRLAFPIFAFQVAEGCRHTSDAGRYAKRLLAFALLSELPFDLMVSGSWFFPFHQNVLFTLLLGLWAIRALDGMKQAAYAPRACLRAAAALAAALVLALLGFVDYGPLGVLTVVVFHVFRGFPMAQVGRLAALMLINLFAFEGMTLPLTLAGLRLEFPLQGFAVLALIPIWLYNGQRGGGGRGRQLAFYAFYPVHMLVLGLAMRFL